MNTQQRIEVIEKELQELKMQLKVEEDISPKQFLLDILGNELTIKVDREKYPNSVFYFQGETYLLEFEKSENETLLWCNYYKIWNPISNKFSLNYASIQNLIQETVEEHFKMRGVTPPFVRGRLRNRVEEHFKMRGVTPATKNL